MSALVLALAAAVLMAGTAQTALAQNPQDSHCGTETGDGPLSGFMTHEQVGEALRQIERTSQGRVAVEVAGHTNLGRQLWTARVGHGDQLMLVQSRIHGAALTDGTFDGIDPDRYSDIPIRGDIEDQWALQDATPGATSRRGVPRYVFAIGQRS